MAVKETKRLFNIFLDVSQNLLRLRRSDYVHDSLNGVSITSLRSILIVVLKSINVVLVLRLPECLYNRKSIAVSSRLHLHPRVAFFDLCTVFSQALSKTFIEVIFFLHQPFWVVKCLVDSNHLIEFTTVSLEGFGTWCLLWSLRDEVF